MLRTEKFSPLSQHDLILSVERVAIRIPVRPSLHVPWSSSFVELLPLAIVARPLDLPLRGASCSFPILGVFPNMFLISTPCLPYRYGAHAFQVGAAHHIPGRAACVCAMFDHEPLVIVLEGLLIVEPRCEILLLGLTAV